MHRVYTSVVMCYCIRVLYHSVGALSVYLALCLQTYATVPFRGPLCKLLWPQDSQ